jgi:hypothetical protein
MEKENSIKCPKCGTNINVNEVLYRQLEGEIRTSYDKKSAELQQKEEKLNDTIEQQVKNKIKIESDKLEKSLRKQIDDEKAVQIEELQKELGEKSEKLKNFHKMQAEIERLKRENSEQAEKIALEKEREFSQKLNEEKQKIKEQAEQANYLKIKDLEKQIDEQKEIAKEALRRAEQGSMQRQGEIQEIELENMLHELYKYDEITEVKKGQLGADILQIAKTENGSQCGKIYYESKRTKHFSDTWLQKLRDDNLSVKADILVLVTEAMPDGYDKYFYKDGIWICSFWEVKGLSFVLRYTLLKVHSVSIKQQGKETKMEMLYNYLTSQEFSGQFGAIIEGFRALQESYNDEKIKMQKIWKEREKQLEKILRNTVEFYGSVKGIAGTSIPDIKTLEEDIKLLSEI